MLPVLKPETGKPFTTALIRKKVLTVAAAVVLSAGVAVEPASAFDRAKHIQNQRARGNRCASCHGGTIRKPFGLFEGLGGGLNVTAITYQVANRNGQVPTASFTSTLDKN